MKHGGRLRRDRSAPPGPLPRREAFERLLARVKAASVADACTSQAGARPQHVPLSDDAILALMASEHRRLGVALAEPRELSPLLSLVCGDARVARATARRLRAMPVKDAAAALKRDPLRFLGAAAAAMTEGIEQTASRLSKRAGALLQLLAMFEMPPTYGLLAAADAKGSGALLFAEADALDELLVSTLVVRRGETFIVPPWVRAWLNENASVQQRSEAAVEHARRVAASSGLHDDELAVLRRAAVHDAPPQIVACALAIAARADAGTVADELLDQLAVSQAHVPLAARAWVLRARRDPHAVGKALAVATAAGDPDLIATAQVELGLVKHRSGDVAGALAAYEAAYATKGASVATRSRALVDRGTALHDAVRLDQARECYEQALGIAQGRTEGAAWLNLGVLLHEEGELARARLAISQSFTLLGEDPRLLGIAKTSLGAVLHEGGAFAQAVELHREAAQLLVVAGDLRSAGICAVREAVSRAACGDGARSRELLLESEPALLRTGEGPLRALLELGRALVGDLLEVAGARPVLERAAARARQGTPAPAAVNDDVRFLLRLAERVAGGGATLRVAADGTVFVTPAGERQSLAKHRTARRILLALTKAHRTRPLAL